MAALGGLWIAHGHTRKVQSGKVGIEGDYRVEEGHSVLFYEGMETTEIIAFLQLRSHWPVHQIQRPIWAEEL